MLESHSRIATVQKCPWNICFIHQRKEAEYVKAKVDVPMKHILQRLSISAFQKFLNVVSLSVCLSPIHMDIVLTNLPAPLSYMHSCLISGAPSPPNSGFSFKNGERFLATRRPCHTAHWKNSSKPFWAVTSNLTKEQRICSASNNIFQTQALTAN